MVNEEIDHRNWFMKSWKWLTAIIVISVCFIFFIASLDVNAPDFAQAYSDQKLFQDAFDKANANKDVQAVFGKISEIDKLAILEGNVKYFKEGNSVEATIRVAGSKAKGKMDITADKINEVWNYTKIEIRNSKTTETLIVLN